MLTGGAILACTPARLFFIDAAVKFSAWVGEIGGKQVLDDLGVEHRQIVETW